MMMRTRRRAALLAALTLGIVLNGCGSENDAESATATDASVGPSVPTTPSTPATPATEPGIPPGTPDCVDVWKAGAKLPMGYRGCVEQGALVKADGLGCESGQTIIRFAEKFYGVAGGTIHEGTSPLLGDPDYTETVAGCRA